MKKEISNTIPIESTPSDDISFTYCLKNILMRSGREKERPIKMRYFPNVFKHFNISISKRLFLFLMSTPSLNHMATKRKMKSTPCCLRQKRYPLQNYYILSTNNYSMLPFLYIKRSYAIPKTLFTPNLLAISYKVCHFLFVLFHAVKQFQLVGGSC